LTYLKNQHHFFAEYFVNVYRMETVFEELTPFIYN